MKPSLEGWPTKGKEAPSPHEVRLTPLDTNSVFQCLGGKLRSLQHFFRVLSSVEFCISSSRAFRFLSFILKVVRLCMKGWELYVFATKSSFYYQSNIPNSQSTSGVWEEFECPQCYIENHSVLRLVHTGRIICAKKNERLGLQ